MIEPSCGQGIKRLCDNKSTFFFNYLELDERLVNASRLSSNTAVGKGQGQDGR